jgi:arginine repressor
MGCVHGEDTVMLIFANNNEAKAALDKINNILTA